MHVYALFVFVFVALAHAAPGVQISFIVGGKDSPVGKYPYQVSLKYTGMHMCGGSIIDEYNILTAAHCIEGLESSLNHLNVHAGTNTLDVPGDVYSVESIAIHKNWSSSKIINDIGIIHLKQPIQFNEKVQPIKLATTNIDGGPCKLTGWGFTMSGGSAPNNLQEIDLLMYPYDKCNVYWQIRTSHICTLTKSGEGVCNGDSGGPLVANGVQIGIVSFGARCGYGYPDVYTRIYYYKDWIVQHKKPSVITSR